MPDASPAATGDRDNEESSTDDEAEEEPAVESLVVGRAKRVTAGNRLTAILNKEQDDDLELLFAENEEEDDVEFEDEDEVASDAQLESSSDEEDQGPTKGDDDLAGEKELQKQDRLERSKKRKAQGVFKRPSALRKKVKIDPSATPTTPVPPRPRKRSERVSWVPTEADAPVRASSRKQTVKNRAIIRQRLVESEQTRTKLLQQMEAAAKRKVALKPKALTQADRMEEAAKTERKNAKSLNRWEESEKKRSEEQKAKLEALHNRQLTGPVVAWWSGLARWVDGKIRQLGVKEIREAGYVEKPTMKENKKTPEALPASVPYNYQYQSQAISGVLHPHSLTESSEPLRFQNPHSTSNQQQITFAPPQGPYGFLDGIHAYAALPMQQHQAEFTGTADEDSVSHNYPPPIRQHEQRPLMPMSNRPLAPEIEFATRTLVALRNIDANALKLPEIQNSVLLRKKGGKLQSKSTMSGLWLSHTRLTNL